MTYRRVTPPRLASLADPPRKGRVKGVFAQGVFFYQKCSTTSPIFRLALLEAEMARLTI